MIHDAARPNFSLKLLIKLKREIQFNNCVVPAIQTVDSIKQKIKEKVKNLKRKNIYFMQTPQAFNYNELFKLQKNKSLEVTDDANLFVEAGKKIKIIKGELKNKKITINSDINSDVLIKYGLGFDVHRLVPNKKLYLGGIKIPSKIGTLGHSDGDPVLHAIIDAVLGACSMGDIGQKFSDKNKKFKNIRSTVLLDNVINQIRLKISDVKKSNIVTVLAPISGWVTKVMVNEGASVGITAKKLIQISANTVDIDEFEMEFYSSSRELEGLTVGQSARVAMDTF